MNAQRWRWVAAAATAASAILYYLIGFGVLGIGESTSGETDLLGFGLVVGSVFAGAAVAIWLVGSRLALGLIGFLDAIVLVGYFALASVREPPFEIWGLTIKVLQAVALVGIGMLVFGREAMRPRHDTARSDVLTARASSS